MKSILDRSILFLSFFTVLVLFSCSNLVELKENDDLSNEYGSLIINASDERMLDISDIKYANVFVSGYGIKKGSEPSAEKVSVTNGEGSVTSIEKIPVGRNRIITVQAYDASKEILETVTLRAICNINKGSNTVNVSWSTTALGNVLYELNEAGYNVTNISNSNITTLKNLISDIDVSSPCLIDSALIAADYKSGSLQPSSTYKLQTASLTFSCNLDAYSVQVCDPLSQVKEFSSSSGTVTEIAPGTWKIYFIKNGKTVKTLSATFESGKTLNLETVNIITDKIVLHVYGYTHIWAYNPSNESENYTGGKWPGVEMQADSVEGWYMYTIEAEEAGINFSYDGSTQTSDLSQTVGEWWYKEGAWYDEDPSDYINPVILTFVSDKAGTVSDSVVFTLAATDNKKLKKADLYVADTKVMSKTLSGTSDKVYFTWDTTTYKNASYDIYAVVYDNSLNSVQSQTITLLTSNENLPPVAVITGSANVGLGKTKTYNATSSYDPNGSIVSYKWSISGGAQILSGQGTSEVSIKFPETQSNCVLSLTVTDDDGAASKKDKNITVQEKISSDFREESIYFVITTRFYDGDKSNNVHCWDENANTPSDDPAWRGDFKGLIEKLDYIKALGFSAVWITPVVENCSGLDYHGYHAMNFSKVDPRYESAGVTFQNLIDAVHEKGMKLVLDVVFNHTGNFGEAYLAPMFEKDYSADLEDINACLKLSTDSILSSDYFSLGATAQYAMRLNMMKNTDYVNHDVHNYYHHFGFGNWDDFSAQWMQIAGDCVDLNTENIKVLNYIVKAYSQYIEMGVDAFRIDTGKHISRLSFNKVLNDAFMDAASACGNDNFYMFSEICSRSSEVTYRGSVWNASPYFYTWKEDTEYGWTDDENQFEGVIIYPESEETGKDEERLLSDESFFTRETVDGGTATPANALAAQKLGMATTTFNSSAPKSDNALLNGNSYHTPDYSKASGLNVIDFPMHWNFNDASSAFSVHNDDDLYNDATWNVVYVDSHDYAPSSQDKYRFAKGADVWAENLDLMFTFRGIPCLYYGSEIEFMAGAVIDNGPNDPLCETGRAYYGDNIEGTVVATDFSEYTASGTVKETLEMPLAKHIQRLNKIRREIPALQKGQYSTENCGSSNIAFKRRYTDTGKNIDSFVLVTINADTTFSNLPAGTYTDAITGDVKTISSGGSITTSGCTTQGNMRVYVLNGPGKIGEDTNWLK